LGKQSCRPRKIDLSECSVANGVASSAEQRIVWPREGNAIKSDERQGSAWNIDALEEP
jgi:hypothetical protein